MTGVQRRKVSFAREWMDRHEDGSEPVHRTARGLTRPWLGEAAVAAHPMMLTSLSTQSPSAKMPPPHALPLGHALVAVHVVRLDCWIVRLPRPLT